MQKAEVECAWRSWFYFRFGSTRFRGQLLPGDGSGGFPTGSSHSSLPNRAGDTRGPILVGSPPRSRRASRIERTAGCPPATQLVPPPATAPHAGAAVVNLPVCTGSAAVDDTPVLMSVIQTSSMNTFCISPEAPCYVHFTGANVLPSGTKLMGTPGRSILRLFTGTAGQAAGQDGLTLPQTQW